MDKFTKSIWITTKISASGERGVSLKELNERWCEEKDENEIPRKSFENYRRYIEDMFGINIDCVKSRNAYVIHDADEFYDNKTARRKNNSRCQSILTLKIIFRNASASQKTKTMNIHAEVLQPESFRNEIKTLITNMLGKYQ